MILTPRDNQRFYYKHSLSWIYRWRLIIALVSQKRRFPCMEFIISWVILIYKFGSRVFLLARSLVARANTTFVYRASSGRNSKLKSVAASFFVPIVLNFKNFIKEQATFASNFRIFFRTQHFSRKQSYNVTIVSHVAENRCIGFQKNSCFVNFHRFIRWISKPKLKHKIWRSLALFKVLLFSLSFLLFLFWCVGVI